MQEADSHNTIPTPPAEQSLQSRVKAAGMRLQHVDNNRYTLVWRHQMVVSDLTLLEAAMFIHRALDR